MGARSPTARPPWGGRVFQPHFAACVLMAELPGGVAQANVAGTYASGALRPPGGCASHMGVLPPRLPPSAFVLYY